MQRIDGSLELSATDLVGYLNCHHLSRLDRAVAEGSSAQPQIWDPSFIVGSPQLFEVECRTPRQIQMANAFCRYLELAGQLTTGRIF